MKGNCCFSTRVGKRQFFKLLQKFNRDIMCVATSSASRKARAAACACTRQVALVFRLIGRLPDSEKKRSFLRWGTAKQRKAPKARVMI